MRLKRVRDGGQDFRTAAFITSHFSFGYLGLQVPLWAIKRSWDAEGQGTEKAWKLEN